MFFFLGKISLSEFSSLFKVVFPHLADEVVKYYFKLVDADDSKEIDLVEFLDLGDVMLYRVESHEREKQTTFNRVLLGCESCTERLLCCCSSMFRQHLRAFIETSLFDNTIFFLILANTAVLIAISNTSPGERSHEIYFIVDSCFLALFVLEMVCKLVAYGVFEFCQDGWRRLDFCIISFALMVCFLSLCSILPLYVLSLMSLFSVLSIC